MTNFVLYFTISLLAATGVYFFQKLKLKHLLEIRLDDVINIFFQLNFWIGLSCYSLCFILSIYLINVYKPTTSIISLLGVYIIVTYLSGLIFMGENINATKILAIILIISGIFLLQK